MERRDSCYNGHGMIMDALILLSIALLAEILIGDPPTPIHPVGWMGKLISLLQRPSPTHRPHAQLFYGFIMVFLGVGSVSAAAFFLLTYLDHASHLAFLIVGGLLLKSTFAVRGLGRQARDIRHLLTRGDVPSARARMNALVSRDAQSLSESQLVAATVESVAENTSDSFVAPLFYFLLFGVPGALAYRMANTFDAMIGYHGKYEYLGKAAARLDDILNFIPARLTAVLMVMAAFILRHDPRRAWRIMMRDHSKTESPNAGWPMSAAAGALGIELEKIGHYRLGDACRALSCREIDRSIALMYAVAGIWISFCLAIGGVIAVAS